MEVKKYPNVNVGRNSSLYFVLGLNLMLIMTYIGLEHKTYQKESVPIDILMVKDQVETEIPITTMSVTPPPPPPPSATAVVQEFTVKDNFKEVVESVIKSAEITQDTKIYGNNPNTTGSPVEIDGVNYDKFEGDVEVPFAIIQKVPSFPGCTGNNEELKKCFQQKMNEHLQKNFNYPELAREMQIKGRVFVLFLIDKNGNVTNIKTRGPDKLLETEAKRIISLLPKMKPGMQYNKPVGVTYSIPINFDLKEAY